MGYSGAGGKLIHEKNEKEKSPDTIPLKHQTSTQIFFFIEKNLILQKCFAASMNQFKYAESP
jgi:hypothetical protein